MENNTTTALAPASTAWLYDLAERSLSRRLPSAGEALAVLASTDDQILDVVAAAGRVRRAFFGNRVKLNYLVNMKSGLCGEDCSYCSQRRGASTGVLTYNWVGPQQAAGEADRAAQRGARRVCLVASGRGPSDKDIERVSSTVSTIKDQHPELEVCVCLGLLGPGQADRLKEAGVFAYNHNLNTASSFYGEICTTHTFEDRVSTVSKAVGAGLSPCSGVIVGMGETDEQLVDVALQLRQEIGPDSVPVNFLVPFQGTPLAGVSVLTPQHCLRVLAMFRFIFPDVEVRVAGGRELHLRTLQPLALHLANSIFLGDYLTLEGAEGSADLQMIADAGFVLEGATAEVANGTATASAAGPSNGPKGGQSKDVVALMRPATTVAAPTLRKRGPGTGLPGNV